MQLEEVFKQIGAFFIDYCAVEFEFAGVTLSIGAVLIWTALASIIISIIKRWVS